MKIKKIAAVIAVILMLALCALPAFAANEQVNSATAQSEQADEGSTAKAYTAAALVGGAACVGAIAMGWAISTGSKSIARQPEAASNVRTNVMLGLVFIETAIIYALIVAILIIFVL